MQILQCGDTDYWGMVQTHSVTEVLKARLLDLEEMLYRVMKVEEETGIRKLFLLNRVKCALKV